MSTVRPLPDPDSTAERWLAGLARALDREERAAEAASFEELVAAAGREFDELDDVSELLWAERTARDPGLVARAESLARFRSEAYPESGRLVAFPRHRVPLRRFGWLAAAAGLLLALAIGLSGSVGRRPGRAEVRGAPGGSPAAKVLFHDDFEKGDSSSWSAVSGSG